MSPAGIKKLIVGIIGTGIVIALIGTAGFLWIARTDRQLDGEWTARMVRPGSPPSMIRFVFRVDGRNLTGSVGSDPLENGTVTEGRLRFRSGTGPASTFWTGVVRGREIDLIATAATGLPARGIARKRE